MAQSAGWKAALRGWELEGDLFLPGGCMDGHKFLIQDITESE
jgi:hypothetical protein